MNNWKGVFQNDSSNQVGYPYQQKKSKVQYSKHQLSALTRAMMVTGFGFLATFVIGILTEFIASKIIGFTTISNIDSISVNDYFAYMNVYTNLIIATVIGLLVSVVLSLIWSFRVYKASTTFAAFTIAIYCLANGIGFGALFLLVDYWQIMFAFGILGLIFLFTFGIAKIISFKTALNIMKVTAIATIVYLVFVVIVSLLSVFVLSTDTFNYLYLVIIAVSGLLSILYMVYELWLIQNLDKFYVEEELSRKLSIFMGFQVLVNLINLVWIILRLFAAFRN